MIARIVSAGTVKAYLFQIKICLIKMCLIKMCVIN